MLNVLVTRSIMTCFSLSSWAGYEHLLMMDLRLADFDLLVVCIAQPKSSETVVITALDTGLTASKIMAAERLSYVAANYPLNPISVCELNDAFVFGSLLVFVE